MNQPSKVLLIVTAAGIVVGAGLSQYVSPAMKFAAGADWRERYRPAYSDTAMQFVDAGPIDLAPSMPWLGATGYTDEQSDTYIAADYVPNEAWLTDEEPLEPDDFAEPVSPPEQVEQAVVQAAATVARIDGTDAAAQRAYRTESQSSSELAEPASPTGSAHAL